MDSELFLKDILCRFYKLIMLIIIKSPRITEQTTFLITLVMVQK